MSISELHLHMFRFINDVGKEYPFFQSIFIFFAEYALYVLALGILFYWFTRTNQNRMMVLQGGFSFLFAEVLGKLAGQFYSHTQPFATLPHVNKLISHEIDNSFPSDHTILFISFCFSFWLVRKKEGWLWLILACFVGISRIGVGVHYPIDVLTAAFFGIVSAVIMYWIVPKLSFIVRFLRYYEKIEERILPKKKTLKH